MAAAYERGAGRTSWPAFPAQTRAFSSGAVDLDGGPLTSTWRVETGWSPLVLLPAGGCSLAAVVGDDDHREAAMFTFVVTCCR